MLTHAQLSEQLHLQNQLNCIVHPDWVNQGFSWTRAIMVESTELLDHIGWKWWKHQELDIEQAWLEMVDIWHFILSHELASCDGDQAEAAGNLADEFKEPATIVSTAFYATDLQTLGMRELVHALIGMAASGHVSVTAFVMLMDKLTLSWDELHRQYLAKNVLNIFRQNHGYKTGEYAKVWGKFGEDNQVLAQLMEAKPDATAEQLMEKLESVYTTVIESAAA